MKAKKKRKKKNDIFSSNYEYFYIKNPFELNKINK